MAELVAEREDAFFGARFFFIAARAAHQRIKALFFNGFNQCNGLGGVARIGFAAQDDAAFADGFFYAADHKLYAGAGDRIVAELDDFGVVVAGIDVQEFERQFQRAAFDLEGFDGKRQQDDGVFAAGKQQGRVLGVGNHFADDVDGLGFEPVEVVVLDGHFFSLCNLGDSRYFSEAV